MDQYSEAFREEAYERLAELEASLLEMEENLEDPELISCAFRALHTIKGSGAMFGFDDVAAFAHELETAFDLVRSGRMAGSKELVELALSSCDQIRTMLEVNRGEKAPEENRARQISDSLLKLIRGLDEKRPEGGVTDPAAGSELKVEGFQEADLSSVCPDGRCLTYRIRFKPAPDIFLRGTNPLFLLNELRGLGRCKIVAQTDGVLPLCELNPEHCYTYWDIILTTNRGKAAIEEVFIFVEDECDLKIDEIDEGDRHCDDEDYKRLGEILIERGDLTLENLRNALGSQKRLGEILTSSGLIDHGLVSSALLEQEQVREVRKFRQGSDSISTIRVPANRLDSLVNLVGELMTLKERLTQNASKHKDPELIALAKSVDRLSRELRENTMNIRMLPIGTIFSKFRRLIRDLSAELHKEVEIETDGAETELDKTIIERLNDPLVHLIRNAMDHGIEPPEARKAAGKPRRGTVHLSAIHSGANVLIHIMDDGAGIDAAAIRAKAIERNLIKPDDELSEKELFSLIFAPGFSTASEITNISGRGVGMDVVKKSIEALQGTIEISSRPGAGTTVTLNLPLTLVIIDGLMVKVSDDHYVVPLSCVERCDELAVKEVSQKEGNRLVNIRGELIPYVKLRDVFRIAGEAPPIERIVIAQADGGKIGIVVDQIIGSHQTMIKSLGRVYRDVEAISGATILGNGTVGLILDVAQLVHRLEREEVLRGENDGHAKGNRI